MYFVIRRDERKKSPSTNEYVEDTRRGRDSIQSKIKKEVQDDNGAK